MAKALRFLFVFDKQFLRRLGISCLGKGEFSAACAFKKALFFHFFPLVCLVEGSCELRLHFWLPVRPRRLLRGLKILLDF